MDADELDICTYLKTWAGQFVSGREISRRAGGKKRYRDNPEWAAPVLANLVEKKILETDSSHYYRLPQREKKDSGKKWVSPQIKAILEKSSQDFSQVYKIEEMDDLP